MAQRTKNRPYHLQRGTCVTGGPHIPYIFILNNFVQNYRVETNEATDLGSHLVKKRTLKAEKRINTGLQLSEHKSEVLCIGSLVSFEIIQLSLSAYHGSRARYLYFQCLQLLFRKQISAMMELFKLPDKLEAG
jgi:RNA polymerase I-specific transcription initiation factor RRN7